MSGKPILLLSVFVPALCMAAGADTDPADQAWLSTVQQQIAREEYHVSWQDRTVIPGLDQAWQAPNRSHNLRTYFTGSGIRVVRRTESEPTWEWTLTLTGYGRGNAVNRVNDPVLVPRENRIEYDRGGIVEWYVNDPGGLEQGFTLSKRPEVEGGDEPACLVLELGGTLSPYISADRQAIEFTAPGGAQVLRYSKLLVTDARGEELDAWFAGFAEDSARGIRIVFDDRDALYPVTVDPLATSPAWTLEADQANARMGNSVATAGDVNGDRYSDVIIGAPEYDAGLAGEGRVLVFHGSPSGLQATADWTLDGGQAFAYCGESVATAGDVNGDGYSDVIIGLLGYDNGESNEGRAVVYHGSASGLSTTVNWSAEPDQAYARFGISVATAGDVNGDGYSDVIVGAEQYDAPESNEGKAFLYFGGPSGVSPTPDWVAESNQVNAYFAASVATAGDVNGDGYSDIIIGSRSYDGTVADAGGAMVYLGSDTGPSATADWTGEGTAFADNYGRSVSTAGDVNGDGFSDVLVGADGAEQGEGNEGLIYLYYGSASGLPATADWNAGSDQVGAALGYSVSTAGDVNGDGYADIIAGASTYDGGETNEGRAYVFFGSSGGPASLPAWTTESDQADAWYGWSVATAGDVDGDGYSDVIVGARWYDNGQTNEGRVYVFHGSAAGLAAAVGDVAQGDYPNGNFGIAVSSAGDVNGDGYGDVIVGADQVWGTGAAYVYHGHRAGISVAWAEEGDQGSAHFGASVSGAGDVNGDGYSDVIIGAPEYDNGHLNEGRVFVLHGSPATVGPDYAWSAEGDRDNARFGYSTSTAGDVNGDGYSDIIVGAIWYENGEPSEGQARVYHGSASGLSVEPDWTGESDQAGGEFGCSVSQAGDINGDGYGDVVIGACGYDSIAGGTGRVYAYLGSPSGLSGTPTILETANVPSRFGVSVSTAGDVNGDGYSDIIVGDDDFYSGGVSGVAYVYHGSASGLTGFDWTRTGPTGIDSQFGHSVSTAGDVNGDGYADVIIGAPGYTNGQSQEGRAYVYYGSSTGLSVTGWAYSNDHSGSFLGYSVDSAGDINGDGYADVIVGGYGVSGYGRALIFFGNEGPGLSHRPQQRRVDDLAPLSPLAVSDSRDAVRLKMTARTPFGRGRVRVEHEVKPFGTPLDGLGTATGSWIDSGTAGVVSSEIVAGLEAGTLQHWRMRLLYDPVMLPFQPAGRWITGPWNGREEADFRTRLVHDLEVSQTDAPDPVLTGAEITYAVQVTNHGPDPASILLDDTLPMGVAFASALPSQGSCDHSTGQVNCDLGNVDGGNSATVDIVVTAVSPGMTTNTAAASAMGDDPDPGNNTSMESTDILEAAIGDFVWEDLNGDGVQDAGEPGMEGVVVAVYDHNDTFIMSSGTDSLGLFSLGPLTYNESYYVRFFPPEGYVLTAADQGDDDSDSDADPVTWKTPVFRLVDPADIQRWDAGMVPDCVVPDETAYIYAMTLSDDGNDYPIVHFQNPRTSRPMSPATTSTARIRQACRRGPGRWWPRMWSTWTRPSRTGSGWTVPATFPPPACGTTTWWPTTTAAPPRALAER